MLRPDVWVRRVGGDAGWVGVWGRAPPHNPLSTMAVSHVWREAKGVASAFGQVSAFLLERGGAAQREGAG